MIWSDNDVANDFTVLKNKDGEQVKYKHKKSDYRSET